MPPTIAEWKAVHARKPDVAEVPKEVFAQAAVAATLLTNSPEWDTFLRQLQPLLEEAQRAEAGWLERCGGAVEEKDVRVAQFNYQACKARVQTLREVMELPRKIISQTGS